jgi:hypothetical protein
LEKSRVGEAVNEALKRRGGGKEGKGWAMVRVRVRVRVRVKVRVIYRQNQFFFD